MSVIDLNGVACAECHRLRVIRVDLVENKYRCTACGYAEDAAALEARATEAKHPFVRGAESGPYRLGPPDETCAYCQRDPRNAIHDVGDVLTLAPEPEPPTADAATEAMQLTGDEAKAYRRFAAAKAASVAAQVELARAGTELRDAFTEMCRVKGVS